MKKIFNPDDTLNIPYNLHKKKIDKEYVILAHDKPNWIILDEDEYKMFVLIDKDKRIIDILKEYSVKYNFKDEEVINCMQSILNKIVSNSFFETTISLENEPIAKIKKNVQIHLTHKCNMRCIHCYMAAGSAINNELSENQWIKAIEEISENIPSTEIVFTGGEPLSANNCLKIMEHTKKLGNKVVLFTNGVLINKKNILEIAQCVDEIQVSMEGITQNPYENVRGKGNYSKLMNALNLIKRHKIPLTLAITMIPTNIKDIEENMIPFLDKFAYEKLNVRFNDQLDKEGYAKKLPEEFFTRSSYTKHVVINLKNKLIEKGYSEEKKYQRNIHFKNCGIGCSVTIDSNGEIYPCSKLSVSKGNILTKNIKELIKEFNIINEETEISKMKLCSKCELKYICSGGCRIDHLENNGSYLIPACSEAYKEGIYRTMIEEGVNV